MTAHPDDESSKGAATLAHYASLDVEVLVVTCTGGERGDVLNPALDRPEVRADLPAIRRRETAEAARILGVRQHFLGFPDSGLPASGEELPQDCFATHPLTEITAALVRQIREFRPQVVFTYDETGGYPHPDHLRAHATQSDPTHPFLAHPRDPEREVWPFEDYHLAWSTVPTTIPESDLFAGLRD
ncbi:PIG-L family deacetylase [Crossiella sp. CA-258035]|uniref:PIG-L family deacetylase n=1 Tax=Crossiella sp. CA-258035 TaxID=2981138 RepID=UPI0024BCCF5B|nr:PIG-L family deacetylase [Crossiella sp. CA-258035]WHT22081.1 PIG-L family deacetylase [Crossiella sp. CA-258035]